MDDRYQKFLSSIAGTDEQLPSNSEEDSPHSIPGLSMSIQRHHSYLSGYSEPGIAHVAKAQKSRRKSGSSASGSESVKHRRTRSGCFTCRSRRVKCDEARPVCERCRKGNRDCVYPDPPPPKGSSTSKSKDSRTGSINATSTSSNDEEDDNDDASSRLATIPDKEEIDDMAPNLEMELSPTTSNFSTAPFRPLLDRTSQDEPASPSSSVMTNSGANYMTNEIYEALSTGAAPNWLHLPLDFHNHLTYFTTHITNYHYLIPCDGDNFFSSMLLHFAIQDEGLLNAVTGFAAYHAALEDPNGNLHDFLTYYNRSVSLLLASIKHKEPFTPAMLLSILQLASIEEYLGDWVNLMGHQKAAFEIITKLFKPDNVMQTPLGRMCLRWYFRFDNSIALLGGFPTMISRDWIAAMVDFAEHQTRQQPGELRWKLDARQATLLAITYEMSLLYARASRGQITPDDFTTRHHDIRQQLFNWKDSWDPQLTDPQCCVAEFPWRLPLNATDIVDPYKVGVLYKPPLFNTTIITAEWHAIVTMHQCQKPDITVEELSKDAISHAYAICQTVEALQRCPITPAGVLPGLLPNLSLAALFLPQDEKHHMWLRRKFALMESLGYIHPVNRRKKLADLFRDASCLRWWLPNDEGFTPTLQAMRTFADERNTVAVDQQQESLREVRNLFEKLEAIKAGQSRSW